MSDIKMDENSDIAINEFGDIELTESIIQQAIIRLRWIEGEWRLGPGLGLPYFEQILTHSKNTNSIGQVIRSELMQIEGVTKVNITETTYDSTTRSVNVGVEIFVGEEKYKQEVAFNV